MIAHNQRKPYYDSLSCTQTNVQRKVGALKNELGVCQRVLLCDDGCSKIEVVIDRKELAILIVDGEERVCLCVPYKSSSE
jgi:hypothetical protein